MLYNNRVLADKANVLGVNIDLVRLEEVLEFIRASVFSNRRLLITHVHVMAMNIACQEEWFRDFLNSSNLVYCDGMGVKLGARILGYEIPQRITLADWVWQLAELAEFNGFSLFLLGNPPGASSSAGERLRLRFPALRIAGACHGFFDKSPDSSENEAVIAQINSADPDILLVGFGMPIQEKWVKENLTRLHARVVITCGGLFEYIAGNRSRGPRWMTDHYLEWLARLFQSPRRYGKRYLLDNPLFIIRVLKQRFFPSQQ